MQQTKFSKINTLMAWLTFAIAAVVYGLTVEPTASLWDCPEFITCGYKLEIGHPPGAPFFMLVANLFSQFASSPSQVALMVNLLSALLSAGCIFFLFLTITHLAKKLINNIVIIETCGLVGSLAYTFSDTFWFSAVEAEVYAFSSFLTALMFWLILKWESEADSPRSDRWILLIAYITGLSIGVHLLCLLCLPAMAFVVWFRKKNLFARLFRARRRLLKLSLSFLLLFLVGFSSYGVILVRANACPPMSENEPKTLSTLGRYLSREQYGKTPLYPRIYSMYHAQGYENWMGDIEMHDGVPTKAENLRYFLTYQMNFMYWRYFFWNFVGRQNNIQGQGEVEHGNWITGFRWIDDLLLGCDTSKLPSDLADNKGRNVFYGLPLLLGLLGICWQWRQGRDGRRQLWIVSLFFVMTGLAIVVYLNQTPMPPRERDYVYVGSFYAFSIWIGLGAAYLKKLAPLALLIPLQMVSQTWDDHDRSGRYTCRDFGRNYLMTMPDEGYPVIFTNGDNDTFPLWYNHEVEGVRRDTRDCNLEYLQTDWYIDQMKRPAYDSPALPISWSHDDYQEGRMEYLPVDTDSLTLTSGKDSMTISLKGKQYLLKNELMVLQMLSNAVWKRPFYVSVTMGNSLSFLRDHLVLEGLAYRISPSAQDRQVDVERLYDNLMHRYRYGGLSTPGLYVDEDVRRMANTHQFLFGVLIDSLLQQGDTQRALKVCRKWQHEMPEANVPYTDAALAMARCFYLNNLPQQGDDIVRGLLRRSVEWLSWIATIDPLRRAGSAYSRSDWMQTMRQALVVAAQYDRTNIYQQYIKEYDHYQQQD